MGISPLGSAGRKLDWSDEGVDPLARESHRLEGAPTVGNFFVDGIEPVPQVLFDIATPTIPPTTPWPPPSPDPSDNGPPLPPGPPERKKQPGEWMQVAAGPTKGESWGAGAGIAVGIIAVSSAVNWIRNRPHGNSGPSQPAPAPPPSAPPSGGPSSSPYPVPSNRTAFKPEEKAELAHLTKEAERLTEAWEAAVRNRAPVVDSYRVQALAAAQQLVSRAVELMGLPKEYASRISFDDREGGYGKALLLQGRV
jgi:hypothetical protein